MSRSRTYPPMDLKSHHQLTNMDMKIFYFIIFVIMINISSSSIETKKKFLQFVEDLKQETIISNLLLNENEHETNINVNKIKKDIRSITLDSVTKDNEYFSKFSIPLVKYFLKFASYAYCSEEKILSQTCCPEIFDEDNWKLIYEKKVSYDNYNYAILISMKYRKIIITFPGTRSLAQLIKELYYSNGVNFHINPTEKIMKYLLSVYSLFRSDLEKDLESLFSTNKEYQFIFTGHSLGGNMASIAALYSVKYGKLKILKNSPMLITYGQSRVGNDIFANEIMKYLPIVYRLTRQGDIVSNIPFCELNIMEGKCKSILLDSKFDKNLNLDDNQKKKRNQTFMLGILVVGIFLLMIWRLMKSVEFILVKIIQIKNAISR